jgi:hypothetical protein
MVRRAGPGKVPLRRFLPGQLPEDCRIVADRTPDSLSGAIYST